MDEYIEKKMAKKMGAWIQGKVSKRKLTNNRYAAFCNN